MPSPAIEQALERAIGLRAESIGSGAIDRAVALRMGSLGVVTVGDYESLLRASSGELQELVEAVVVPETWFFRDAEAIRALREIALQEWGPSIPKAPLRALSIPCSTGEEPYTIAMTLEEAGIPADRCEIHGVDVSLTSLEKARQGVYSKNSFRGADLAYRDRFFRPTGLGFQILPEIKNRVRLARGNILDPDFWTAQSPFDIIFCRNLLIYFDPLGQQKACAALKRFLKPKGYLFGGAAEAAALLRNGFQPTPRPRAFRVRENGATAKPEPRRASPRPAPIPPAPALDLAQPPPQPTKQAEAPKPTAAALEEARRLADQGRLGEAAARCEAAIAAGEEAASAHYLLAVVREAQGRPDQALPLFKKAVYLDPNHYEALMSMALLAEKSGDANGAALLRGRAKRALDKTRKASQ